MIQKQEMARDPYQKYEEAVLELATYELAMEELQRAEQPLDERTEREMEAQYRASLPRMLRVIQSGERKRRWKEAAKRDIPRVLKAAAALVLALNMGLTVAFAVSDTVRAQVVEFMLTVRDEYTEVGFVPTGEEVDVPEEWTFNYYPTYIPEGYELADVAVGTGIGGVVYVGKNNHCLSIDISDFYSEGNVDTEGSTIYSAIIHGNEAMIAEKEGEVTIVWHEGEWIFTVMLTEEDSPADQIRKEAMRVAESFSTVQK